MLFLLFQLGEQRYALEARRVVEILPFLALSKIPQSPRGLAGIFMHRGQPLPALDLCELLLHRPARERLSTRIIVINYQPPANPAGAAPEQGDRRMVGSRSGPTAALNFIQVGLIAEGATEMMRREAGDFSPPGVTVAAAPYLGPVLMDERGVIQWLQADQLVASNLHSPPPIQT